MFSTFNISASGLTAQRLRMDIIAGNIANVNTTRTVEGGPYRRKLPVFQEKGDNSFSHILQNSLFSARGEQGVKVSRIIEDDSPLKIVYRPEHPDADQNGYLALPNIDITTEMVDMIEASRAYEANITALNTAKDMALQAIEIGRA